MDGDTVELGNLHRQIVHTESSAHKGLSKVASAVARCKELNSEIRYVTHEERASPDNILEIVAQYDLVLDCTDNPATRYLISDACVVLDKVLVSGAAQRGEGMLVVLNSPPRAGAADKGPCYRCVFPRPPPPEMVRGCSEIGILGPVVGVIGTLMAGEAIKLIAAGNHKHAPMAGRSQHQQPSPQKQQQQHTMLLYNTYATDPKSMFRTVAMRGRRKDCLACGDDEALALKGVTRITADVISQGRLDYQAFCGVAEDTKVLDEENRVEAKQFLQEIEETDGRRPSMVIDVREEHEFELGAKVLGSVNIPISRILRLGGAAFDVLKSRVAVDDDGDNADDGVDGKEDHDSRNGVESHDDGPLETQPEPEPGSKSQHRGPDQAELEGRVERRSVYFVCQRGNDSQIAAQKMIDWIQKEDTDGTTTANGDHEDEAADQTQTETRDPKQKLRSSRQGWGWIGDVKGGFVAMEKHVFPSNPPN
ncbi:molybdopterin biosynthesis protein MoeB [Exophiala dermatitidis NIH/UT8656]|uniref:Molybdopterin biosynthesis protein MoeB n=1 Tax=Exophiala dermatitidis (strain ATCC 34100 / CBS 525.76 / NIH/UT8656) TaxID=858893 RepID=H6BLB1_EXODN|nr:molybdopterin biosynthesis protein MoeB [Exophiala dermatitidis NIH/UT8656]EHY51858.1 molybdopterin biosynthesis protein MoeB [Exophiala dermatitidis NIH/UT8656]